MLAFHPPFGYSSSGCVLELGFIATLPGEAVLKHFRWRDVEQEQVNPLLDRQLLVGEKLMLSRIVLRKGCLVPLHQHENEQISYIAEGALKFLIEEREIVVRSGEVLCIPPNLPHQAEALEDTLDFDIFYPPRADWLAKTDDYLRGGSAKPAVRKPRKRSKN
jgi:quercetin dioxygenase-like cupin family protein